MGQTLTNFADALKHFYTPVIREQLVNNNILWKKVTRDSDSMVGDEVYMTLHTGRNEGIGARAELADLPTAGQQAYKQIHFPLRYNYGRIQVTGQVMRQSRSSEGAYAQALKSEVEGVTTDLKLDLNRQIYGDGTGKLCVVTAGASNTVQTVDDIRFLRIGMKVDQMASAGTVTTAGLTINAINTATKAVTFSAAIVATAGDFLVRAGSYNVEITGIDKIIATGNTYLGINRATAGNEYWQASVGANGGTARAISEILLQTQLDNVEIAGGDTSFMLTTHGVRRSVYSLLATNKRFVNTMDLGGGFSAIEFAGKPLTADKDCPKGTVYGLDLSKFKIYNTGEDFTWLDQDGAMLSRVPNKDAYEAVLLHYVELACDRPAVQFKLADITES
jgi:hypothetical protein